jgi:hypothetical protein
VESSARAGHKQGINRWPFNPLALRGLLGDSSGRLCRLVNRRLGKNKIEVWDHYLEEAMLNLGCRADR